MQQADSQKKRIFLEATAEGLPVYERNGWRGLERVELDYGQFGGEGGQVITLMMRPS